MEHAITSSVYLITSRLEPRGVTALVADFLSNTDGVKRSPAKLFEYNKSDMEHSHTPEAGTNTESRTQLLEVEDDDQRQERIRKSGYPFGDLLQLTD